MNREDNKLNICRIFLLGGVIFSMHFGGSSMIWPMTWGQESGSSVIVAFSGIFFTALLFPLLGYIALARGKGSLYQITTQISPKFAKFFCGIIMLVLGPLFCIPRMSAAAWDAFTQLINYQPSNILAISIFSISYYLLTYWFICKKDDTVDKISRLLFPVLVIAVIVIIGKGLLSPLAPMVEKSYEIPAFVYGFTEGYSTLELPCALVYATIIINNLKSSGIKENDMEKTVMKVAIVGITFLTLTHLGHMIVGANTGELFSDIKYASLYTEVVVSLLGPLGGAIFNVGLMLAALTTAIGLSLATSDYFVEVSKGKLKYRNCALMILATSTILSIFGLSTIIKFTAPLLDIVYPAAITLTLYYALIPNLAEKSKLFNSCKIGVTVALLWGIFEGILGYMQMFNININILNNIHSMFPLAEYRLGWISVTILASIIGYIMACKEKTNNEKEKSGHL